MIFEQQPAMSGKERMEAYDHAGLGQNPDQLFMALGQLEEPHWPNNQLIGRLEGSPTDDFKKFEIKYANKNGGKEFRI